MSGPAGTDRAFLRDDQYRDERNLEARRAIYAHAVAGGDFITPAIAALDDVGTVLDVGCGPGVWHGLLAAARPACRWIGLDLSPGMAAVASGAGRSPVSVADAVALPVGDDAVDAALSVHMLYHVPPAEQPVAVGELARVVRPGGPVVITTNAGDHLAQLDELLTGAGRDVGLDLPRLGFSLSFLLDDAGESLVADVLGHVRRVDARGRLAIPDADVVARYIGSLGSLPELGQDDPDDDGMVQLVAAARRRAQEVIDRHGSFEVGTHAGAFIARA